MSSSSYCYICLPKEKTQPSSSEKDVICEQQLHHLIHRFGNLSVVAAVLTSVAPPQCLLVEPPCCFYCRRSVKKKGSCVRQQRGGSSCTSIDSTLFVSIEALYVAGEVASKTAPHGHLLLLIMLQHFVVSASCWRRPTAFLFSLSRQETAIHLHTHICIYICISFCCSSCAVAGGAVVLTLFCFLFFFFATSDSALRRRLLSFEEAAARRRRRGDTLHIVPRRRCVPLLHQER